jgi:hypothetical protein
MGCLDASIQEDLAWANELLGRRGLQKGLESALKILRNGVEKVVAQEEKHRDDVFKARREYIAKNGAQYKEDNKEHIAKVSAQYYQDNKEHFAQYREDNKERRTKYGAQYRKNTGKRRATDRGSDDRVSNRLSVLQSLLKEPCTPDGIKVRFRAWMYLVNDY